MRGGARVGVQLAPLVALLALLGAISARPQEARVQVSPGPHYAGEPIHVRISVQGFEEEPVPEVEFPDPAAGTLRVDGVQPNVKQSISIINGQMSRSVEVTYLFDLVFETREPGQVTLGPLRVTQGARAAAVAPFELQIDTLPTRDDFALELSLPDRPIYVGERAPLTLRLRLASRLQRNMESYTLRVPLFDEALPFQFLDADGEADTQLVVTTEAGPLPLRGSVSQRSGEVWIEAQRTLVPLAAGVQEIPPATLIVTEGVAFQRDLWGGRRATRVRKWSTSSPPVFLEVRPVPERGRPASFSGTVGRGFALAVTADRSVVRVGDPITLTFELRGEGLETATLPPLSSEGLLPASGFRVPEGELVGEIDGDVKRFRAVVRVADERVTGIPELAFSWFDPETERFETATSQPIALSVSEGRIVGADDVARAESAAPPPEAPSRERRAAEMATTTADLSIERSPERLLRGTGGNLALLGIQGACYAAGFLCVAIAWRSRRRRDEDPTLRARRETLARLLRRLEEARGQAPEAALDTLADGLRRIRAEVPYAEGAELDALVGECEALRFAPGPAQLDPALLDRVSRAATRFVEAHE